MLVDSSGLWANQQDGERAVAAILLEHTHFEVLCRCSQQMDGGSDLDVRSQTSTATLVALRWPNDQRAFCCFVENTFNVGGDCGLFHELGVEVFLKVLEHCPLHSRLVLTEFTNKSFRMMRLEPRLFSTLRLHQTRTSN